MTTHVQDKGKLLKPLPSLCSLLPFCLLLSTPKMKLQTAAERFFSGEVAACKLHRGFPGDALIVSAHAPLNNTNKLIDSPG